MTSILNISLIFKCSSSFVSSGILQFLQIRSIVSSNLVMFASLFFPFSTKSLITNSNFLTALDLESLKLA